MSHFNSVANKWDTEDKINLNLRLAKGILAHLPETLRPKLEQNKLEILDFGCGTGLLTAPLSANAARVVGIDTSDGMLAVFRRKFSGDSRISCLNVDLTAESNGNVDDDGLFDLVVCCLTFHHLKSPQAVLSRLLARVAPGGAAMVVDLEADEAELFHEDAQKMGVHHHGFQAEEARAWAPEAFEKALTVDKIRKGEREFPLFLAIFSKK